MDPFTWRDIPSWLVALIMTVFGAFTGWLIEYTRRGAMIRQDHAALADLIKASADRDREVVKSLGDMNTQLAVIQERMDAEQRLRHSDAARVNQRLDNVESRLEKLEAAVSSRHAHD